MSLESYKSKRTTIKRNMSRIKSMVDGTKNRDDRVWQSELKCRLGILEAYFKQAISVQSDIEEGYLRRHQSCHSSSTWG